MIYIYYDIYIYGGAFGVYFVYIFVYYSTFIIYNICYYMFSYIYIILYTYVFTHTYIVCSTFTFLYYRCTWSGVVNIQIVAYGSVLVICRVL
jgi:hypothetical protein